MRRYLSALAVALVALSGAARVMAVNQHTLAIVIGYDLDSTDFVYPIALGPTAVPSTAVRPQAAEGWYESSRTVKTADYDTSVVSCTASTSSLDPISVGDIFSANDKYNRPILAGVAVKSDADSIELDRSVELTQSGCAKYRYRKLTAGEALYDGWFSVAGWGYTTIQIDIAQETGTGGIDAQIECMTAHSLTTSTVYSSTGLAAGSVALALLEPWEMCRVGFKWADEDDIVEDVETIEERISVFAIRRDH